MLLVTILSKVATWVISLLPNAIKKRTNKAFLCYQIMRSAGKVTVVDFTRRKIFYILHHVCR